MSVVLQNQSFRATSPHQRVRQRGFTLIEILIVIAISAGMLFGVFTVANRIGERSAINEFASNMNVLAAETSAAFRAQGNFNNVTHTALLGMHAPPVTMRGGTPPTTIVSPWGTVDVGPVTIASAAPTADGVQFTVRTVPAAACSSLVTAAEGAFSRVLIGTTAVKNMTSVAAGTAPAMSALNAVQVGTACAGEGTRDIHFIMTR